MPNISFEFGEKQDNSHVTETLKVTAKGLKGMLQSFTGQSGDYWVSIIPSLNVSGYGPTEDEAREDLAYNFDIMCQDLFSVDALKRFKYLKDLGWEHSKIFKKQFSKAYVDENGILQNFDRPEEVKRNVYQAA